MHVSSEPEILSTRQELGVYLRRRVAPVDVNCDRSFSLDEPYSVPKSEPCAITGMHSTATSRVAVLEADSDQILLLNYLRSLRSVGLRFQLGHPSNIVIVKSNLRKHLEGEFPTLVSTLSDMTLNKLTRLLSSDNKHRELQWKEGGLHLDPYRKIMVLSQDYNDSMFQLVLLNPDQFSGESLTVHNPITNTKGVYVAGTDGYLRESPGGTDCPIIPPIPFYEGRPRAAHRTNPFFVALSSAFIFLRYQSNPARFNGIPEKARALLLKTLRIKELLEWKLRTEQGLVPPRREFIGSMADLSLWTTGNQAEVEDDGSSWLDANPIDYCLTKIPDEHLKKYLNAASDAYIKTEAEGDSDSETDYDESSDPEEYPKTVSSACMRVGEGKDARIEGDDNSSSNYMNSPNSEDRQARLAALYWGPRSGDRSCRKEFTGLQYGAAID